MDIIPPVAVMAGWLPGRTAAGLKQAYAASSASAGISPQVAAALKAHSWPSELTALMEAWPGPPESVRVRTNWNCHRQLFIASQQDHDPSVTCIEQPGARALHDDFGVVPCQAGAPLAAKITPGGFVPCTAD